MDHEYLIIFRYMGHCLRRSNASSPAPKPFDPAWGVKGLFRKRREKTAQRPNEPMHLRVRLPPVEIAAPGQHTSNPRQRTDRATTNKGLGSSFPGHFSRGTRFLHNVIRIDVRPLWEGRAAMPALATFFRKAQAADGSKGPRLRVGSPCPPFGLTN